MRPINTCICMGHLFVTYDNLSNCTRLTTVNFERHCWSRLLSVSSHCAPIYSVVFSPCLNKKGSVSLTLKLDPNKSHMLYLQSFQDKIVLAFNVPLSPLTRGLCEWSVLSWVCVRFLSNHPLPLPPPPPPLQFLWWVTNVLSSHVLALCEDVILFDDQVSRCDWCVCNTSVMQCDFWKSQVFTVWKV